MSTLRYRLFHLLAFLAVTVVYGFWVASAWATKESLSDHLGLTGLLVLLWVASLVGAWFVVYHLDRRMRG